MTYEDYIQSIDAAWTAAQQDHNQAEAQILGAILFRLVHPPQAAIVFLTNLAKETTDPAIRKRYKQAIADIGQCEAPTPRKGNNQLPETIAMPEDGPVSAEQLAQLSCKLYQQLAPKYGLSPTASWEALPEAQQHCAIAVAHRLLRRVDARMRYILGETHTGPLLSVKVCDTEESEQP